MKSLPRLSETHSQVGGSTDLSMRRRRCYYHYWVFHLIIYLFTYF